MAIGVRDAIRIAQIIARAPEQRLTMIMSALELADITLEGLEEIEAFRKVRNGSELVDTNDFISKIRELLGDKDAAIKEVSGKTYDEYALTAKEFTDLCIAAEVNPKSARRFLAERGYLILDSSGRNSVIRRNADGKPTRMTVIRVPWEGALTDD